MQLYILHGNGLNGISQKLTQIRRSLGEVSVTELNGKSTSWGQAKTEIGSASLFEPKRLVILEDFKDVSLEETPGDENLTLVLKFSKALTAASPILKEAPKFKAQVFLFTEEHEGPIFPFLDLLAEKNPRAISELEKNLGDWGGQYVLTMMAYSLRRFITSPKKLPPFVIRKMNKQRQNFPLERIKELYKAIIETDFKIKSGLMEEKLGLHLLVEKFLT
jgi:DNA polymerase III delta subunit